MNLALYGILVVLALFIVLMVFNPNLACFGRKLKSPLYPVLRKRKQKRKSMDATDYGFDLGGSGKKRDPGTDMQKSPLPKRAASKQPLATEDYGFDLGGGSRKKEP
jgi:hypothetical protein